MSFELNSFTAPEIEDVCLYRSVVVDCREGMPVITQLCPVAFRCLDTVRLVVDDDYLLIRDAHEVDDAFYNGIAVFDVEFLLGTECITFKFFLKSEERKLSLRVNALSMIPV